MDDQFAKQAHLLLYRLERISADSPWAHRASGIRSSLAKSLARGSATQGELEFLLLRGFWILEQAASEIPDEPEERSP